MAKTVTVNVTQEHIAEAKHGSCSTCPLANALHDAGYRTAVVSRVAWYPGALVRHALPPDAREFVRRFDMDFGVLPATFEMPLE